MKFCFGHGALQSQEESVIKVARIVAQVRHARGQNSGKPFRISLGGRRVYTTFALELKTVGEAEAQLIEQ